MINEVVNNRAGIALYITIFALIVLVEFASIYVLKAEAASPDANITSAEDAVWWVFVTVTTVGYGDRFPVTGWGRIMGITVMFGGIALIGVLASFLSNFFLAPPKKQRAGGATREGSDRSAENCGGAREVQRGSGEKLGDLEKLLCRPGMPPARPHKAIPCH
jgi:voltage-gated potassium channel